MFSRRDVRGAIVRGILPQRELQVSDIGGHMRTGHLDALVPGEFRVVLGADLARTLSALPGYKVTLIAPQGLVAPAAIRASNKLAVASVEVGMYEYDSGLALIHLLEDARTYQMGAQVSGLRLKLDDLFAARWVGARDDARPRQPGLRRRRSHANFFSGHDVDHPDADRRCRRIEHRVDPGDAGHRQERGHRDPAHARCRAGLDHSRSSSCRAP